jgi:hypothetical protein
MWWSGRQELPNRPMPQFQPQPPARRMPQAPAPALVIRDKENGRELFKSRSASLECADLSKSRLRYADLSGQNLHLANLNGANLWGADLSGADLRGADLRNANLRRVNLEGARLAGANLTDAMYDPHTIWPDDFDLSWEAVKLIEE